MQKPATQQTGIGLEKDTKNARQKTKTKSKS